MFKKLYCTVLPQVTGTYLERALWEVTRVPGGENWEKENMTERCQVQTGDCTQDLVAMRQQW